MRTALPVLAGLMMLWISPAANAASNTGTIPGCPVLAARVDAVGGDGPAFLASFDDVDDEPALLGAAFTYDNALAAIALVACGDLPQARRVGDALLAAATSDRAEPLGRLRNAYRAGAANGVPQPHGWWDAAAGRWAEDPTQVGTATGNVAWAGLALLTMAQATGDARYRAAAERLGQWAEVQTWDRLWGGFSGGIHGDGAGTQKLGWKSTEHNADLAALFGWLGRTDSRWQAPAEAARAFLNDQWLASEGRFQVGTLADGHSPNRALSGLDAEVWPLLLTGIPHDWKRVMTYVRHAHGVVGKGSLGFDFNDDRDGIWWEGTAQVALAMAVTGDRSGWHTLVTEISHQYSPGGLIWATSIPRLTTGLALSPASTEADFFYYRRPHLGATAWAILAASRWNPFTGRPLP